MTWKRIAGWSFAAAPPLVLVGWALMRLNGAGGQEPGWTLAHIAWGLNAVMHAVICVELYRRAKDTTGKGRVLATGCLIVGVLGAVCLLAQMVIDLVVGFATDNRTDMRAMSGQIHDLYGVQLAVYDVGPVLLFLVLITQAIHVAVLKRGTTAFAALVTLAVVVSGTELLLEIPLRLAQASSALILWIAFVPVARELSRRDTSDVTRATRWRSLAGWSLILAPVGQVGGWTLMMLGGNDGDRLLSTVAHTVWLIGFLMLGVVCVELYRRVRGHGAGQLFARVSLAVALISIAASVLEMLVDLYTLFATVNRAQMEALDEQIRGIPGAEQILYGFGTQAVYIGFLALVIQLAVLKRISATTLTFVLATLVLFVGYELLDNVVEGPVRQSIMPLAVLCMWLALAPLGWRLLKPVTTTAGPRVA
ncbi:hypothetical protein [Stackebrandtia nassauensis]|uniref:Uncharacterized protein n=1 Tax=Stackebrandtia nassauensis (strain DSM 44728 / CIP 108903 / NRRL B-16338 / NBRC 102104 / LLR-40K-21) TaxID=446470 RepID=D3Q3A6_STANL|nr:hypothetical protein [Stackebrandtia nassauensis]ADD41947.1 hypothetical protein Snas_2258 [Stackebrandtia nassauensis DSM 44728]